MDTPFGVILIFVERADARTFGDRELVSRLIVVVGRARFQLFRFASSGESVGRFPLDRGFRPIITVFSGFLRCSQSGYRIFNKTMMRESRVHLYTTQELASPSAVALASALRPVD